MKVNRDSVEANFLNGQSLNDFIPLLIWGLIGLLLSVLLDILRNKNKISRSGGFSLAFFMKDNVVRFVVSIIAVLIGCIFTEDLFSIKGNLGALLAGFMTDKIIEALVKFRSNINIDLSSIFKSKS